MAALVFTNIRISSQNISWSAGSVVGGSPGVSGATVAGGAVGLVGTGTFRVRMAVQMNEPVVVYFSPTYQASSSVVRVYATPPLVFVMS
jgi:hypothetical protein